LQLISDNYTDLINFFALARHSFSPETLYKLGFDHNIKEKLCYLNSYMLLDENNSSFQLKQRFRGYIALKISLEDRINIHNQLHEIYSEQISTKLEERILPVSRGLLYSEQDHHFTSLIRLEEREEHPVENTGNTGTERLLPEKEDFALEIRQVDSIDGEEQDFLNNFSDEKLSEIKLTDEEKAFVLDKPAPKETEIIEQVEKLPLRAEEELIEMLIASEKQDNKLDYNLALFKLANLHKEHFRHDQALTNYYAVLNSKLQGIPDYIISESLESIGEIYDYRRDYTVSASYYIKALNEAEKAANTKQKARIYFKMALSCDDAGDFDKAFEFYGKNIDVSQDIEVNPYLAASYSNTAAICEEQNSPINAIDMYKKSLDFDIQANNLEGQHDVFSKLGNIYFEAENYSEAGRYFYKELDIAKKIDDPYKIAMSYIDIGDIFLVEKNHEKAIKAFILAKKSIDKTISTDSREKINRRFKQVITEIGRKKYSEILDKFRAKNV